MQVPNITRLPILENIINNDENFEYEDYNTSFLQWVVWHYKKEKKMEDYVSNNSSYDKIQYYSTILNIVMEYIKKSPNLRKKLSEESAPEVVYHLSLMIEDPFHIPKYQEPLFEFVDVISENNPQLALRLLYNREKFFPNDKYENQEIIISLVRKILDNLPNHPFINITDEEIIKFYRLILEILIDETTDSSIKDYSSVQEILDYFQFIDKYDLWEINKFHFVDILKFVYDKKNMEEFKILVDYLNKHSNPKLFITNIIASKKDYKTIKEILEIFAKEEIILPMEFAFLDDAVFDEFINNIMRMMDENPDATLDYRDFYIMLYYNFNIILNSFLFANIINSITPLEQRKTIEQLFTKYIEKNLTNNRSLAMQYIKDIKENIYHVIRYIHIVRVNTIIEEYSRSVLMNIIKKNGFLTVFGGDVLLPKYRAEIISRKLFKNLIEQKNGIQPKDFVFSYIDIILKNLQYFSKEEIETLFINLLSPFESFIISDVAINSLSDWDKILNITAKTNKIHIGFNKNTILSFPTEYIAHLEKFIMKTMGNNNEGINNLRRILMQYYISVVDVDTEDYFNTYIKAKEGVVFENEK